MPCAGSRSLPDGPVGRVSLGDVVGPDVVDQPLGQSARQQQVALCHRDETIPQSVVPELRAARLADQPVEMSQVDDMARGACGGRNTQSRSPPGRGPDLCPAAFEAECVPRASSHGRQRRHFSRGAGNRSGPIHNCPARRPSRGIVVTP